MNGDRLEDYPTRQIEYAKRKILASVDGKPNIIESGLEHRTGNYLTSLLVFDSIGYCVFSEIVDLPIECKMANEVKTLTRDKNGLPTLIRKNQLGESLTHGIARALTEHISGEQERGLKVLNQQQIVLEWDVSKHLKSATTYQLAEYRGEKEIWTPESIKTFQYDGRGRLVRRVDEEFSEDGHAINNYFTYKYDEIAGQNRAIEYWYTNNNFGEDRPKNQLSLHDVYVRVFDPGNREQLIHMRYSNVQITPKKAFLGSAKPIYAIKPDYGDHLVMNADDLQKLIKENDVRALRLIKDDIVPQDLNVPTTLSLSSYR